METQTIALEINGQTRQVEVETTHGWTRTVAEVGLYRHPSGTKLYPGQVFFYETKRGLKPLEMQTKRNRHAWLVAWNDAVLAPLQANYPRWTPPAPKIETEVL